MGDTSAKRQKLGDSATAPGVEVTATHVVDANMDRHAVSEPSRARSPETDATETEDATMPHSHLTSYAEVEHVA